MRDCICYLIETTVCVSEIDPLLESNLIYFIEFNKGYWGTSNNKTFQYKNIAVLYIYVRILEIWVKIDFDFPLSNVN